MRVSNFLLWQISYAELVITPTLWPDFQQAAIFRRAGGIRPRDRRFGGDLDGRCRNNCLLATRICVFRESLCYSIAVSKPFRLGVLGSGKGSNFAAIADAIDAGKMSAQVGVVLSDVEGAGILSHAREREIAAQFIPPGKFRTKLDEEAERDYVAALQAARVDLIVLAGFMRVLEGRFSARVRGAHRQHPSVAAAVVSRTRSLEAGAGPRREGDGLHGAFR